ncbi:MAG: V-type ATP synthase subunit F [Burkholderiales bacterium]
MAAPIFLGDDVAAAGFRLAGATVRMPRPGDETAAFAAARREAGLVLVAADVAARIDPATLRAAQAALTPLVAIVPDVHDAVAPPDLAARLRAQLGFEA